MRHFELLHLLGKQASVRAAARQMALTQPAVSKLLQEIEECFEATLFERTSSGVIANAAGKYLIAQATQWINHLERSGEEVIRLGHGAAVTLRIGTFSILPRIVRAVTTLRKLVPHSIIIIREAPMVAQLSALADGQLDCVVGALPPEVLISPVAESLRVKWVADDALCVMAGFKHKLVGSGQLEWSDMTGASWVLPPKESLLRRAFIDAHLAAGLVPPVPDVELLSPIMVAELLTSDEGLLGLMRLEHAQAEQSTKRLIQLNIKHQVALPPLSLITCPQISRVENELIEAFTIALKSSMSY